MNISTVFENNGTWNIYNYKFCGDVKQSGGNKLFMHILQYCTNLNAQLHKKYI